MRHLWVGWVVVVTVAASALGGSTTGPGRVDARTLYARGNMVAWCIVPFDARKRAPEERAAMLERIGIRKFAWDWRDEHLPRFEEELDALERHHVELTAVWFPGLDAGGRRILDVLAKRGIRTQLWVSVAGTMVAGDADPKKNVDAAVASVRPIADEAAKIGCTVGVYNHGGLLGEPEQQLAVVEALGRNDVGIVYNLHHGHDHLGRLKDLLPRMVPHLMCVNLNGMMRDGEKRGLKIVPIGQGELDEEVLRTVLDSGYRGPVGVLNHTDLDAEPRLLDNIEGLEWMAGKLDGRDVGDRPEPRTFRQHRPATRAAANYWSAEDGEARKKLPVYRTIEAARVQDLTAALERPGKNPSADTESAGDATAWARSHGGDGNQRYSQLGQITPANVGRLKVAWTYHSGDGVGNIQCNPVIVDGVIYAPTVGESVVAIEGQSGREVWRFKPGTGRPAYRGLTYHKDADGRARVLFCAGPALWAVDAGTGAPIDSFGDGGKVKTLVSAVAPAVFGDVVVIAGFDGDVMGYDLATGKERWVFHTVPTGDEAYADTWDKADAGANAWAGIALDSNRGIVYVTTGSPKSNFIGSRHRGDNLFADCVIAIDAVTGVRLWHFQEIRHDIWDWDIPAPPVLVTVDREGKRVDAVAAVTKLGNTLLLDRVTGRPLFPFRMRRAPVSTVPGEETAPYQPDLEWPQPFARTGFRKEDVTDLSPESRRAVLKQIEGAKTGWFEPFDVGKPLVELNIHGGAEWTGACFDPATGLLYVSSNELPWMPAIHRNERPPVDETKLPKTAGRVVFEKNCMICHGPSREGVTVAPALWGLSLRTNDEAVTRLLQTGRGSMPAFGAAISADDRRVLLDYLFERDDALKHVTRSGPTTRPERPSYVHIGYPKLLDHEGYPGIKPPWGLLNAIDLNTGKIAWRVPLGEYEALTRRGIPRTGTENFGGATVTAGGLVFCAGTRDIKIRAFDKRTGEELWSHPLPYGGFAPPATYWVNGKQYLIIAATGGGKLGTPMGDAYVAFALP